jgi:hypothetical protein
MHAMHVLLILGYIRYLIETQKQNREGPHLGLAREPSRFGEDEEAGDELNDKKGKREGQVITGSRK